MSENRAQEAITKFAIMARRVVENATLRALLPDGQVPLECVPERMAQLLEPYMPALLADAQQLREIVRLAYLEGVLSVHADLHGRPGIDNEMLDEAIEHYSNRTGDGEAIVL